MLDALVHSSSLLLTYGPSLELIDSAEQNLVPQRQREYQVCLIRGVLPVLIFTGPLHCSTPISPFTTALPAHASISVSIGFLNQ